MEARTVNDRRDLLGRVQTLRSHLAAVSAVTQRIHDDTDGLVALLQKPGVLTDMQATQAELVALQAFCRLTTCRSYDRVKDQTNGLLQAARKATRRNHARQKTKISPRKTAVRSASKVVRRRAVGAGSSKSSTEAQLSRIRRISGGVA